MTRQFPALVAIALLLLFLSACSQVQDFIRSDEGQLVAQSVVVVGTSRFIRADDSDPLDRAIKTRDIAKRIQESVGDSAEATVQEAAAEAREQIGRLDLNPEEELAADLLLQTVERVVTDAVGEGLLDEDERVRVSRYIGWIVETADAYVQRSNL